MNAGRAPSPTAAGTARRGYTLAEVLVAVAVAALALTLLLFLLRESRRSADTARDKSGTLHHGRLLLEQVKRDLRAMPAEAPAGEPRFERGVSGAAFPVSLGGGSAERVAWAFDAAAGVVTRRSPSGGETVFGRDDARVRRFEILEETAGYPGGAFRRYRVRIALSNREDEPRSRLALETSVVPPSQARAGANAW